MRLAMINITRGGISGGYRVYIEKMLPRLAAAADVDAILCAAPANLDVASWVDPLPNVTFADSGTFRMMACGPRRRLREALDAFGPDVLFVTIGRHMQYQDVPTVCMVHNMEPPALDRRVNPVLERIKNALRRRAMRQAVTRARAVIGVSQFVSDFLVNNWGVPAEKVRTIHYGFDPAEQPADSTRPAAVGDGNEPFLFTAGAVSNDNLVTAMTTWGVYLALRLLRDGVRWPHGLASGALAGLAALSKFSGAALLPLFLLVILLSAWLRRPEMSRQVPPWRGWTLAIGRCLIRRSRLL